MAKKVISIDIGQQQTKVAVVDYGKKNPRVYSCFVVETPKSAVEDGYIRNKEAFTAILKERLDKYAIREREVIFTISSTRIANREIMIPSVPTSKIQSILQSVAQDHFPVDVSEYTFTYSILEKINEKEQKGFKILAIAAPNNLIQSYHELAKQLGMTVAAIDYIGNSTYQIIRKQVERGITMTIQMNEKATFINIIDNDNMAIQRMIPVGTCDVVDRILKHDVFKVTDYKEGYELACNEKIINPSFDIGNNEVAATMYISNNEYRNEVVGKKEVTDTLQNLLSNITRVFDYYNSKYPEKRVTGIYVSGDGAKFRNITKLIYNETGIETQRVKSVLGVVFDGSIQTSDMDMTQFMGAIGAAIAPVRLISKGQMEDLQSLNKRKSISLAFIGSISISAALIAVSLISLGTAKLEEKNLNDELTRLQPVKQLHTQYTENMAKYNNTKAMYSQTTNMNQFFNEVCEEIEARISNTSIISSASMDSNGITLNMSSAKKEDVAMTIMSLKEVKYFSEVTTAAINESLDEAGNTKVVYTLSIVYNQAMIEELENGQPEEQKKEDTDKNEK